MLSAAVKEKASPEPLEKGPGEQQQSDGVTIRIEGSIVDLSCRHFGLTGFTYIVNDSDTDILAFGNGRFLTYKDPPTIRAQESKMVSPLLVMASPSIVYILFDENQGHLARHSRFRLFCYECDCPCNFKLLFS